MFFALYNIYTFVLVLRQLLRYMYQKKISIFHNNNLTVVSLFFMAELYFYFLCIYTNIQKINYCFFLQKIFLLKIFLFFVWKGVLFQSLYFFFFFFFFFYFFQNKSIYIIQSKKHACIQIIKYNSNQIPPTYYSPLNYQQYLQYASLCKPKQRQKIYWD
eukprot:TRINITY_DN47916_c0_g1_i1.p3 TRINITY_DN47916_c0_g1~~TRINITY_DN47916_c0_g1_i1.p3  ORF type:complete len:159 (-),score=1.00 TRINITY_DN47916_c0_g1_i1:331-807(-)